ncbi:metacaspase-1-like isoform X2 [Arachis duranensis]|uniref:Metacaspase-1-like isoform X2 n=1 Tax=Arachis duranensis TaxID=130453 RepID=A0A6P4CJ03_ARADU|nr:metacaspase-1-like isoform X2 [Arachis duranensis]
MASRNEKCSHCGTTLVVPSEVHVFKCSLCHGITHSRPPSIMGPLSHAYNSVSHVADRFRGFINTITNNNNPRFGYNNYYYPPNPYHHQSLRPCSSYPSMMMTPNSYGPKRAVLCGICYHGRSYRLRGSVTDVKCMRYFLMNKFGFPSDSILMLTDDKEERNPLRIPTRCNIEMALRWLIEGSKSGDSLVFFFSGHGTQELDLNMDEIDGYDEAICPLDFEYQGKILDDEINATIVRPLPHGAKLHAIFDACHSGTLLDLPFFCKINREGFYIWEDHRRPRIYKGTNGGLAICISACDDGQVSVDTSALSGREVTGALTYSLIKAMENNEHGLTYGHLLKAMRSTIRATKTGIVGLNNGPIASLLNTLLGLKITQVPQLSSSEMFDIYAKQFVI